MAANVTLRKNLSYDPLTSFLPVHLVGESPNLFVAFAIKDKLAGLMDPKPPAYAAENTKRRK